MPIIVLKGRDDLVGQLVAGHINVKIRVAVKERLVLKLMQ